MADPSTQAAAEVNRELTAAVVDAGERLGFAVDTEYVVPGGRLDVVWCWSRPVPIPGLSGLVPVIGFEIESSWRTRKHVKGDLLNLQDAGVAVGVIVLADADARDESLRRFASALVDRPGPRILIWTHADVRSLATGGSEATEIATIAANQANTPAVTPGGAAGPAIDHRGKYRPLWEWLRSRDRVALEVSFADVEQVLGFPLPDSSRAHPPHWHSYEGSAVARAIIDAGWHAEQLRLQDERVVLAPGPPPGRSRS